MATRRETPGAGRPSGPGIALASLAAIVVAAGCDGPSDRGGPTADVVVRDSAGVRIVENGRAAWSENDGWRLAEEPSFVIRASDGGSASGLLDPTSIDVDARGRIVVGDGNQAGWHAVLVYDSLGRFELQAGREGEGPGEFGQLWWASAYRGDSIAAFDMARDKVSIFAPDGRFAREVRLPTFEYPNLREGAMAYTAGMDAVYGDGSLLAYPYGTPNLGDGTGAIWLEHDLLRLAPDGAAWDTLGTFGIMQQHWSGSRQEEYWFGAFAATAVATDQLYYAAGDRFEYRRYDAQGALTQVVRRAHEPRPVTDELRASLRAWYVDRVASSPGVSDEVIARVERDFASARFAPTVPAVSGIVLDDLGYVWVESFRWFTRNERSPLAQPTTWSVFDATGVWQGDVETPPHFILHHVGADRVLGFVVDEFDVKEVYAYALDRRGGT